LTAQKKFVNIGLVQDFLRKVGGEPAINVAGIYERKGKHVTDEELAKKMKMKVTEVRTVLNRLHYRGIACYKKTKNKRNGWYNYTWEIKKKRIIELILENQKERMEKLEEKQHFGENYSFFICKKNCEPLPFEIAAEYQFKCPKCGETMDSFDYSKNLETINREIEELRKEITTLKSAT
jgi:transcription initiation factor TFIIE subunit alpha